MAFQELKPAQDDECVVVTILLGIGKEHNGDEGRQTGQYEHRLTGIRIEILQKIKIRSRNRDACLLVH